MRPLRSASVLALASIALAAHGQVRYDFSGGGSSGTAYTFTLTRDDYVTTNTSVAAAGLDASSGGFDGVDLYPVDRFVGLFSEIDVNFGSSSIIFGFPIGALAANGTYTSVGNSNLATLVVSGKPVPEPASAAAFGLGAATFLRRRKRA